MLMNKQAKEVLPLLGGVEAGGTKFKCVIGSDPWDIREQASFPTTTPEETLGKVRDFFTQGMAKHGEIAALGIACFGPVDLDPASATYGYITSTPKSGWSDTSVATYFSDELQLPVGFETDVNGAAIGEHRYGATQNIDNFVYVTVGTGIGAGIMADGELLNGAGHPEVGHIRIGNIEPLVFNGVCPFHGDCLEGLASGPAIEARWGKPAWQLPEDHPAWELETHYLATLCVNLTCCYAPEKIILGGGVMEQDHLHQKVRKKFQSLMRGYTPSSFVTDLERYIVAPGLSSGSGSYGALALAGDKLKSFEYQEVLAS
jgi:fructokinase